MLPEPEVTCQKIMVSPRCVKKAGGGRDRSPAPRLRPGGARQGATADRPEIAHIHAIGAPGPWPLTRNPPAPADRFRWQECCYGDRTGKGGRHVASIASPRDQLR